MIPNSYFQPTAPPSAEFQYAAPEQYYETTTQPTQQRVTPRNRYKDPADIVYGNAPFDSTLTPLLILILLYALIKLKKK